MIWLARHGETAYNAERRFQGQGPVGLSERGREQAAELAERAAGHGFVALVSSPLPRARETAEIVAARLGLEIAEDPRLMETDTGEWTDRTFAEVEASDPERFAAWVAGDPGFAFPGGESFAAQQQRVSAAVADIRAAGHLPALVVCHRNSMRLVLRAHAGEAGGAGEQGRRLTLDDVPNGSMVAL